MSYAFSVASQIEDEPLNLQKAMRSKARDKWQKTMTEKMDSLKKNHTRKLVTKPGNLKIIGSKWIFKRKPGIPGVEEPRYKARLVAKGFSEVEGIDFHEVFSPVVKHRSIRNVLALVAKENMELEQVGVKTVFLHGDLDENIHMQQPPMFEDKIDLNLVCLLNKSLYGLKQAPRL